MHALIITPLLGSLAVSFLAAQETPKSVLGAATAASHVSEPARCKASQLIGLALTNSKNDKLGEIQDIVLDSGNELVAYAVVDLGGVLGQGSKYFAMPWRMIEISQRSAADKPRATLELDKKTLKMAPGFDKNSWPDMAEPSWAKKVDEYYKSRKGEASETGAPEPKGSGLDGKSGVDWKPGSKAFVYRRLRKLIGMSVVDTKRGRLADLEDLIVDTKLARIDAGLLSFGGLLDMNEKHALVPFGALTLDAQKNVYVFPCTKARLEEMALLGGTLPDLNTGVWLRSSGALCAKALEAQLDGDVRVADASGVFEVPYADSYDAAEVKAIKGTIMTMGTVRIGDRHEERVRLRVRTKDHLEVIVYGAPATFSQQQVLHLKTGTVVELKGSPVKYGSQTVLVAGSITVQGKTATLRDDAGRPTWNKQ